MQTKALVAGAIAGLLLSAGSVAAEDFDTWPLLSADFESTGGGGVRILDYDPVVEGGFCRTAFRAKLADGQIFHNTAEFDALPVAGGILCTNGRWRARDSDASGTTPFRVFIRDGVKRGR